MGRIYQSALASPRCAGLAGFFLPFPGRKGWNSTASGEVPPQRDADGSSAIGLLFSVLCLPRRSSKSKDVSSAIRPLSSVFCILSSVICHLSSVIRLLSSVIRLLSSVIRLLSSVFCHPSSVFCHPSSVFCHPSSVFCLLSSVFDASLLQDCN